MPNVRTPSGFPIDTLKTRPSLRLMAGCIWRPFYKPPKAGTSTIMLHCNLHAYKECPDVKGFTEAKTFLNEGLPLGMCRRCLRHKKELKKASDDALVASGWCKRGRNGELLCGCCSKPYGTCSCDDL